MYNRRNNKTASIIATIRIAKLIVPLPGSTFWGDSERRSPTVKRTGRWRRLFSYDGSGTFWTVAGEESVAASSTITSFTKFASVKLAADESFVKETVDFLSLSFWEWNDIELKIDSFYNPKVPWKISEQPVLAPRRSSSTMLRLTAVERRLI